MCVPSLSPLQSFPPSSFLCRSQTFPCVAESEQRLIACDVTCRRWALSPPQPQVPISSIRPLKAQIVCGISLICCWCFSASCISAEISSLFGIGLMNVCLLCPQTNICHFSLRNFGNSNKLITTDGGKMDGEAMIIPFLFFFYSFYNKQFPRENKQNQSTKRSLKIPLWL